MTTTNRVFKPNKTVKYSSQAKTGDALLDLSDGTHMIDLSDVKWNRIVVEVNVTTLTGTDFNLEAVTTNDQNFDGSDTLASNVLAVGGDGSTAFASGNISATGRTMFACSKFAADGSAASNIGKYLGFIVDWNATTLTLEVIVHIEGE